MSITMHRPSLTSDEVMDIWNVISNSSNKDLVKKIQILVLKIENGITSGAYSKRSTREKSVSSSLLEGTLNTFSEELAQYKLFVSMGIDTESLEMMLTELIQRYPVEYEKYLTECKEI